MQRELYDLDADNHESKNLADEQAEVANRLAQSLRTWRKSLPASPDRELAE
jgi:hypothetical protein